MHQVPAHSSCSRNTSQFQACCSFQLGGLLKRGDKDRTKVRGGPGLTLSFFLPPGDIIPGKPWQRPESCPRLCPHDWTGSCRHRWTSWPKEGFLRGSTVPSRDSEDPHTIHPALHPLSLSASTRGRFSLWNSGFSSAKCVKRVKRALESWA